MHFFGKQSTRRPHRHLHHRSLADPTSPGAHGIPCSFRAKETKKKDKVGNMLMKMNPWIFGHNNTP